MYAIAATFSVNPEGETVEIDRAQMWQGLVQKAENAVPFVPAIEECRILERFDDGFIREILLRGTVMRERIVFTPEVQVHFERIEPENGGWITNVMSESDRGLLLTFTFALSFPGVPAGSDEERRRGEEAKDGYIGAIAATIAETRRRVREATL